MDQVDALVTHQPAQRVLLGQLLWQGRQAAAKGHRQRGGDSFLGHRTQQAAVGGGCDMERVLAMQGSRQRHDVRGVAATVAVVEVGVEDFHGGSSGNARQV